MIIIKSTEKKYIHSSIKECEEEGCYVIIIDGKEKHFKLKKTKSKLQNSNITFFVN